MKMTDLIQCLKGHEWTDVEFKEARNSVPASAYETVFAFSNTEGGWLVFGVREGAGGSEIVGVPTVDEVQNDFLSVLRSGQKLNRAIAVNERLIEKDGKTLLAFHIPEARRQDKPVYLGGDIRKSFIRRGTGDERCTQGEIELLLRDASDRHYDGQSIQRDLESAFDSNSIRWYRETYERHPGNRSWADLSDLDFLDEMGLLGEQDGRRTLTRAAVLLFGSNPSFRQLLPRPVVDCQRFSSARDYADTGDRWMDRSVLDENLIRTWRALGDWYWRFAERPFRIDPVSLQRDDTPPDYPAYRESMINLLVHQDYSDHTRNPQIRHYADQTVFSNPGDAFASVPDLLEPGAKEVRNPRIVNAFRRIGLSENAGWGLRDVFRNWQQLGYVPPRIINDRHRKRFELVLLKEALLSEEQILFQASLGARLSDEEARAFAFIRREGEVTLAQLKGVTGLPGQDTLTVAERLETQRLIESIVTAGRYMLAEHLRDSSGPFGRGAVRGKQGQADLPASQVGRPTLDLVTDQADAHETSLGTDQGGRRSRSLFTAQANADRIDLHCTQAVPLNELSATQRKIVALCNVPRSLVNLTNELGVRHRSYFRRTHLNPLLQSGVLRATHPDQPKHPDQAYVLTEAGAKHRSVAANRAEDKAGTRDCR